jgi:O-acetyl-ADP-ribose deacetylase (regulator of RNase III)
MSGDVLQNGEIVTRRKIAGEWSEAALVDIAETNFVIPEKLQKEQSCSEQNDGDIIAEAGKHHLLPRAFVDTRAGDRDAAARRLHYVTGDATVASYAKGQKIIAHVCNDQGRWGKGFVMAITERWGKHPGKMYRQWHKGGVAADFGLGAVQLVELSPTMTLVNMIGQSGTKTGSKGSPVRYDAIRDALKAVCTHACAHGASVHMPRIGVGLAGGEWARIEDVILTVLAQHEVDVYVYDHNG